MVSVYHCHEKSKRRQYDQRVRDVEMASFTALVFFRLQWIWFDIECNIQAPGVMLGRQVEYAVFRCKGLVTMPHKFRFVALKRNVHTRITCTCLQMGDQIGIGDSRRMTLRTLNITLFNIFV